MLQHLNSLLSTRSRLHTQLLSYNTTFNFGDFYISGLLFRCICFHENPVLLGLFMMHERKLRSTHKMFVEVLGDKVPALNNSNSVLVTDGELSFEVFEDKFPKLNKIFCWNHVLFSETVAAQPQCVSRRREGVRRSHPWASACDDSDRLQSTIRWKDPIVSQSFKTYYDDEIDRHIGKSFGRVVLERLDVYDVNSGVTQNMSEGFNTVMQRMQEWKEATCAWWRCINCSASTETTSHWRAPTAETTDSYQKNTTTWGLAVISLYN